MTESNPASPNQPTDSPDSESPRTDTKLGTEDHVPMGRQRQTLLGKANALKRYLIGDPSARTPDDQLMRDAVISEAAKLPMSDTDESFARALARDGFAVTEGGKIRRMLPDEADLPAADDEVHALLDELGLAVAKGHLDHAIDLHSQGKWAPANGELRKVLQSIFDEAAEKLNPSRAATTPTGNARRQLLAKLERPFLVENLGEWGQDGRNFVNGVFKRLNPGGHPELSEDEDCTFQLHLVLVTARLFLRRLRSRLGEG